MMMLSACSTDGFLVKDSFLDGRGDYALSGEAGAIDGGEGSEGGGQGETSHAGILTAGEWNDLDNWPFWGNLMQMQGGEAVEGQQAPDWYSHARNWGFYTRNRVAVKVSDSEGRPVPGVTVALSYDGKALWETRTDIFGRADCWAGLYDGREFDDAGKFSIALDGAAQESAPAVTGWTSEAVAMNEYTVQAKSVAAKADIAFVVDATGSMGDEITFLKSDLVDIFTKVGTLETDKTIRTAAVFYRDKGDDYVTKYQDFNTDINKTSSYVKKQNAGGGGDFPEAVHTALETTLQKLSWDENAPAKLAFLILDAPAHLSDSVVESLHKSITAFAGQGIKIIPVAASGVDKSCEFMLRFFAISTGGTYAFLTDDSGVGGSHIEPTVGEFQVELLNDLVVRLISKYI